MGRLLRHSGYGLMGATGATPCQTLESMVEAWSPAHQAALQRDYLSQRRTQSSCTGVSKSSGPDGTAVQDPTLVGKRALFAQEGLISSEAFLPVVEVLEHSAQSPVCQRQGANASS